MVYRNKLTDPWHCSWCSYTNDDFGKVVEHEKREHGGRKTEEPRVDDADSKEGERKKVLTRREGQPHPSLRVNVDMSSVWKRGAMGECARVRELSSARATRESWLAKGELFCQLSSPCNQPETRQVGSLLKLDTIACAKAAQRSFSLHACLDIVGQNAFMTSSPSLETVKSMTNPVIEAIRNRRSVRIYEHKPIPREIINTIIEAGNQAPFTSMTRSQPWRFVIVQDPKFKQKLFQTAFPFWKSTMDGIEEKHPELYKVATCLYDAMDEPKDVIYYNAPVIIFVIGPAAGGAVSCALACENMMIAAASFGLGSCYTGFGGMVKGNHEVVEALELKESEQIYGPILLGYPKIDPSEALKGALERISPNKKEPVTKWI